jgi:hypothetical protein
VVVKATGHHRITNSGVPISLGNPKSRKRPRRSKRLNDQTIIVLQDEGLKVHTRVFIPTHCRCTATPGIHGQSTGLVLSLTKVGVGRCSRIIIPGAVKLRGGRAVIGAFCRAPDEQGGLAAPCMRPRCTPGCLRSQPASCLCSQPAQKVGQGCWIDGWGYR